MRGRVGPGPDPRLSRRPVYLESHPDFSDASSLHSLNDSHVGSVGVVAIGEALKHNKTLSKLW
jgi:hypothetical protein